MFEIEIIHFPPPSLDSPPLFGRETPTPMIISPKPHEVIPCRPPSASVIFRVLVLSFLLTSAVCLLYALEKDDTVDHWLDSSGELGPPFSDEGMDLLDWKSRPEWMKVFKKHPFQLQDIGENTGTPEVCRVRWVPLVVTLPEKGVMAHQATFVTVTSSQSADSRCYITLRARFTLKSGGYLKGEGVVLNHTTVMVVFPEPGKFTLEIMGYGWSANGSAVFLGVQKTQVDVILGSEEDSKPFLTRPHCTARDFDSSPYGYWTDFPRHAIGSPRLSNFVEASQMYTPFHCRLYYFSKSEAFALLGNRKLMFLGDSTQEELIEAMLSIMGLEEEQIHLYAYKTANYTDEDGKIFVYNLARHRLMEVRVPSINTTIHHRFMGSHDVADGSKGAPTFWSQEVYDYLKSKERPDLVVFNSGFHDRIANDDVLLEYQQRMTILMSHMQRTFVDRGIKVVWQTTNPSPLRATGDLSQMYMLHHLYDWAAFRRLREHSISIMNLSGTSLAKETEIHNYTDGMHLGNGAWHHGLQFPLTIIDANAQILLQTITELSAKPGSV